MTIYQRPSYSEQKARLNTDLAALPRILREGFAGGMSKGWQGIHGHLDWIDKQNSPLTCDEERLYDWAALYSVDRLDATFAQGVVLATGNQGVSVLADSVARGPNNLDYKVVAAVQIGTGATAVSVKCTTAGSAGNLAAGVTLTLVDPIAGVSGTLTVDVAGLAGGEEQETVDNWRARVVDEWQVVTTRGARSGKPEDYRFWAKSAHPSVTGALVQAHVLGYGTVIVRPICNGLVDRLPTQIVMDAVAAKFASIVPATADWRVTSPIKRAVTAEIHLLPGFDSAGNRTAISAALNAAVLAEESETSILAVAETDAAIATVTSQYNRILPTADIAVAAGEVLVLNPVIWA